MLTGNCITCGHDACAHHDIIKGLEHDFRMAEKELADARQASHKVNEHVIRIVEQRDAALAVVEEARRIRRCTSYNLPALYIALDNFDREAKEQDDQSR